MAHFTFDTAYIVAHMQASNNKAQIAKARQFLANLRCQDRARWNFSNFETFCWAWWNDCLSDPEDPFGVWPRARPPANCWPYKESGGEDNIPW